MFSDVSHLIVVLSPQKLNMAEYGGDSRSASSRDALSTVAIWFLDEYFSCLQHEPCTTIYILPSPKDDGDLKTTIFVGFLFTLCYQMLTWEICSEPSSPPLSSPTPSPTTNLRVSPPPQKTNCYSPHPLLLLSSKMAAWPLRISIRPPPTEYACSAVYDQWEILLCLLLCNE